MRCYVPPCLRSRQHCATPIRRPSSSVTNWLLPKRSSRPHRVLMWIARGPFRPISRALDSCMSWGRPGHIHRIRTFVEEAQAELLHHDGGVEERKGLLAGVVSRADAIFFPVDCVSHDTVVVLKQWAGKRLECEILTY